MHDHRASLVSSLTMAGHAGLALRVVAKFLGKNSASWSLPTFRRVACAKKQNLKVYPQPKAGSGNPVTAAA
jgi:hypothetical protein